MATAVTVRPMASGDLEPLRWVVYRAYLEVLLRLYGPGAATGYDVRSPEFMAMYLQRAPEGCFTAEGPDGTRAGAVFCFVWGEVGWFGSLSVAPEWQGQGIGQALVRQAVDYLRLAGCRRIGLETWPESPVVHHLYRKFGFEPCRATVKLSRPVSLEGADEAEDVWWAGGQRPVDPKVLQLVAAVTQAQAKASGGEPAVDYRLEVSIPLAAGWAALAVHDEQAGTPAGFALCYLRKPDGGLSTGLDVRLLAVAPGAGAERTLVRLLAACDRRARAGGIPSITCDVNLRHTYAVSLLRASGFRPVYELLRMERLSGGFDPRSRSTQIDCARWAG